MNKLSIIGSLAFSLFLSHRIQAQDVSWSTTDGFTKTIVTIQTASNQQTRYSNAYNYFSGTHGTTKQLQDAIFYLNNDQEKYTLCVAAYPNIIDKNNFINIYNSFSSFSNAIKLYRDTEGKDALRAVEYSYQLNIEEDKNSKYDLLMHQGDVFLSANKFEEAMTAYRNAEALKPESISPAGKIEEVLKWQLAFANLNLEQDQNNVKYEELILEGDHMLAYDLFDAAILSYEEAMTFKAGDQKAYEHIKEANRRKQEFKEVEIVVAEEKIELVETECTTGEQDFAYIMTAIEDQSFSDDRKELAQKQVSKNCLSMEQMKQLVPLFSMDDDKLEMITFMYDYAKDPKKMYLFRDLLTFSGTKKKLDDFLISKE